MQEQSTRPELDWAIELAGQLIEQANSLLISKTSSPDELLANSCQEQQALREYEALLEKATNPDLQEDMIWNELLSFVIDVCAKVRDMISKNSITCLLTGGFIRLISPRYPYFIEVRS